MDQAAEETFPVSVLVPTRDEENNITACLASLSWARQVIVLDSHSRDQTQALAARCGAQVVARTFDDFSTHKNWALDHLPWAHPWILILDADERVTPELQREIIHAITNPAGHDGFYIPRKILWRGRWLKHGGRYPDYNLRLFKRAHGRYEDRLVHEHVVLQGQAGYLRHPLLSADEKGFERYFDRHNHYSSLEAVEILRFRRRLHSNPLAASFRRKGPQRNRALKHFAYQYLPLRPFWIFLWLYLFKAGFLDGQDGLAYCLARSFYELQIDLKLKELADPASPLALRYRGVLAPGPATE